MSATMAAARVADHLGAALVEGEGRLFDVTVQHLKGDALLPTVKGLQSRVTAALERIFGTALILIGVKMWLGR